MTGPEALRPTRAGGVKFGLFYASFIVVPISITFLIIEGLSLATIVGLVASYVLAALAFWAFVASGFYGLLPTDAGLAWGTRRAKVLPWAEIDRIETGRFLGQEIWVRVLGHAEPGKKPPVFAVYPAFVYGMSAAEMRDYLLTFRSRRTGSPT